VPLLPSRMPTAEPITIATINAANTRVSVAPMWNNSSPLRNSVTIALATCIGLGNARLCAIQALSAHITSNAASDNSPTGIRALFECSTG